MHTSQVKSDTLTVGMGLISADLAPLHADTLALIHVSVRNFLAIGRMIFVFGNKLYTIKRISLQNLSFIHYQVKELWKSVQNKHGHKIARAIFCYGSLTCLI